MALILQGNDAIDQRTQSSAPVLIVYNSEDVNGKRVEINYGRFVSKEARAIKAEPISGWVKIPVIEKFIDSSYPVTYTETVTDQITGETSEIEKTREVFTRIDNPEYIEFYDRSKDIPDTIEVEGVVVTNPQRKNLMIALAYKHIKANVFPTAIDDIS